MSNTLIDETKAVSNDTADFNSTNTPIVEQFNKLKQMFLVNDTVPTLSKSLLLLSVLLKEVAVLFWLALCWGIVALSLGVETVTQIAQRFNGWRNRLYEVGQHQSFKDIAPITAQSIFSNGKQTIQALVAQARKQVGFQIRQ
jgi:uncharacterized membrane protein